MVFRGVRNGVVDPCRVSRLNSPEDEINSIICSKRLPGKDTLAVSIMQSWPTMFPTVAAVAWMLAPCVMAQNAAIYTGNDGSITLRVLGQTGE